MRKFLLFLILCTSLNLYAQKISVDRIENDGRRQIMTKSKAIRVGKGTFDFSLKTFSDASSIDWCLTISSFSYISSAAEVLLKLGNGEIIHLNCNNLHEGKINTPGYGIPMGNITYFSPSTDADYYTSLYLISYNDLDRIAENGITKIRFSDGTNYFDKEFSNNSLGKYLKKGRKNIQERLLNSIQKGGLYDDF